MVGYGAAALLVAVVAVVLPGLRWAATSGGGDAGSAGDVFPSGGAVPEQKDIRGRLAAAAANCELKSKSGESRVHTTSLDEAHRGYPTNPPDSGRHYIEPAVDGAYGEAPEDRGSCTAWSTGA